MAGLQALAKAAATARVAYEMIHNSATGCVLRFGSFDQVRRVLGFWEPILAWQGIQSQGQGQVLLQSGTSLSHLLSRACECQCQHDLIFNHSVESSPVQSLSLCQLESLHERWTQCKMRVRETREKKIVDALTDPSQLPILSFQWFQNQIIRFLGYILSSC